MARHLEEATRLRDNVAEFRDHVNLLLEAVPIGTGVVGHDLLKGGGLLGQAETDFLLEDGRVLAQYVEGVHGLVRHIDRLLFTQGTEYTADWEETGDVADELPGAAAYADLHTGRVHVTVAVKVAADETGDELLVRMEDRC